MASISFEAIRYPTNDSHYFSIDMIDEIVQDTFNANVGKESLETALMWDKWLQSKMKILLRLWLVALMMVSQHDTKLFRKDHKATKGRSSTTSPSTSFNNDFSYKRTSIGDPPYLPDPMKKSFMKKTMCFLAKSSRECYGYNTFA